jgi:8-oxo-dGTP diphosphatase
VTALPPVKAAGCVVWRHGSRGPEVLLVHRPRYDDWSYPKGKLDRGESFLAAAVREVEEETGLHVRLGPRLPDQEYPVRGGRLKHVAYWAASPPKRPKISAFEPNHEIDELRWLELGAARKLMTYERDKSLLKAFRRSAYDSTPLLIVRHTQARKRKTWKGDDHDRPLLAQGKEEARRLIPALDAFGISRVISSSAARCVDTVLPYVNAGYARLTVTKGLSEEEATEKSVRKIVSAAVESDKRVAICSHRPVLPMIFEVIGLKPLALPAGGIVVVHRRSREILATEVIP